MRENKVRRVFISATGQNNGKTVVSLGLIYAFRERFGNIGFIKPVGQRYLVEHGEKVDEDSVLIGKACSIGCPVKDMSPVAIEKGFTRKYILNSRRNKLIRQIKDSFRVVARDKKLVVIEGTGHAGVGSVFDLSNAFVAKMLDSKVVIVSSGGIGKPIDEIMLNKALFEKEGVEIAGVIINKVRPDKYDLVDRIVRKGLKQKGLRVLGVIPYQGILSEPTVRQIQEEFKLRSLTKISPLDAKVSHVLVGAMTPRDALNYFSGGSLIITPGDREDMISAVVDFQINKLRNGRRIAGIVLSGGISPRKRIINLAEKAGIPILLAAGDTYKVASEIHDLTIKVRPEDKDKTRIIKKLIEKYVDINTLIRRIS